MDRIINMIIRQVVGQLINRGMRAGFSKAGDMADRRKAARGAPVQEPVEMTQQERRQARIARRQAREARQQMKATRRITKF